MGASDFRHVLCLICWDELHPGRQPYLLAPEYRVGEFCCRCGALVLDAVYIRGDKAEVGCRVSVG